MSSISTRFSWKTLLSGLALSLAFGVTVLPVGPALAQHANHHTQSQARHPRSSQGFSGEHTATTANSAGDYTILQSTDYTYPGYAASFQAWDNPQNSFFVSANWDHNYACGCVYDTHPLGVFWDVLAQSWAIFHEEGTPIPIGATYNVMPFTPDTYTSNVPDFTSADSFYDTATSGNSVFDYTLLDDPLANGNPNAIVYVMQNWNANGNCGCVFNNHHIGVWYTGSRWAIFNEDDTAIPAGATFNVIVRNGQDIYDHTQQVTTANTENYATTLDLTTVLNPSERLLFVTPNYNPNGNCGCDFHNHAVGVWYTSGQWKLFNEDHSNMIIGESFNVMG